MPPQHFYRIWTDGGKFMGVIRTEYDINGLANTEAASMVTAILLHGLIKETFPNEYWNPKNLRYNAEKLTGILTLEEIIR